MDKDNRLRNEIMNDLVLLKKFYKNTELEKTVMQFLMNIQTGLEEKYANEIQKALIENNTEFENEIKLECDLLEKENSGTYSIDLEFGISVSIFSSQEQN